MGMTICVFDKKRKKFVEDKDDFLMEEVGFDKRIGLEGVAMFSDGRCAVCDKCGNYRFLDPDRFKSGVVFGSEEEDNE